MSTILKQSDRVLSPSSRWSSNGSSSAGGGISYGCASAVDSTTGIALGFIGANTRFCSHVRKEKMRCGPAAGLLFGPRTPGHSRQIPAKNIGRHGM